MDYGTYDIESRNWIDFEVLGAFDGKDEYRTFKNPVRDHRKSMMKAVRDFINWIDQRKYRGWVWYGHNAGRFDMLFLIEFLLANGYVKKIIERTGRLISVRCEGRRASWEFRDSYALLPNSLRDLANAYDVPHKKMMFEDYSKISRSSKKTLEYLHNDVLALHEIIDAFAHTEYIDRVQLTVASQALDVYRRRFCPGDLTILPIQYEQVIRERFYSGGRVEVFRGMGAVNSYDVNSLFPYAMCQEMPCGSVRSTRTYHPGKIGFYHVHARAVPDCYLGMFLHKQDGKNYFVNGPGDYYISSATMEFLRKEFGVRFSVDWGIVFGGRGMIFNDYVDKFFSIKQQAKHSNPALYLLSKYMLNALYGKLGAKREQDTLILDDGTVSRFRLADPVLTGYGFVIVSRESHQKFILPYLAAYITDLARLHHFKLMNMHPDAMYYCDTDSLYTTADYSRACGQGLGQLSDTGRWEGIFLAPKSYALRRGRGRNYREHIAFKGFTTDEFTYSDFVQAAHGKQLTQTRERILGFRECMQRVSDVKRDRGQFLKVADQTKVASAHYDKRLILPSKRHIFETAAFHRRDFAD